MNNNNGNQNELLPSSPIPRLSVRSATASGLDIARRTVALSLIWLMVPLGVGDLAYGQQAPPPPPADQSGYDQAPPPDQDYDQGPPPQQWNALSPEQLDQLVAPIALYPDSLVAQVLAASTYPTQVVEANRFVQSQGGAPPDVMAQMVNQQNWDPSVKALAAFPSVLDNMNRNLDWTTQLGNAYYNQPQDVMSAVQDDRRQAYSSGRLRSTPQLAVDYQPDEIVIQPVNPAVVYVPYYNPWAVWGWRPYYRWYAPPPPRGVVIGAGLAFGVGIAIGVWGHWGWGWGHWGMGWGRHPYVMHDRVGYVPHSVTVINHGYYGRFDRHPEARDFNHRVAVQSHESFARGYNAGAHQGFNAGAREGYRQGYNRGAENNRGNFNRGEHQEFNRPQNNVRQAPNFGRPETFHNTPQNRPEQNRGPQSFARPEQNRQPQNFNRPQNNVRQAPNFGRPETFHNTPQNRPAPQARPENRGGGGHPENRGGGHPENHGGGGHEHHGH